MKEIKLTQGKFALVDDEDYEYLNQFKWYAHKCKYTFYAKRNVRREDGTRTDVKMHRIIMNTPEGMDVDHGDFDGLNNQRYNLRNCTGIENRHNSRKQCDNISGYKGVSLFTCHLDRKTTHSYWQACIGFNGKQKRIGLFKTPEEAALAYNTKAIELYGEFAYLNKIGA